VWGARLTGRILSSWAEPIGSMISVYVNEPSMIASERLGSLPDGRVVSVFKLTGTAGVELRAMPYGATIVSLRVPDREGRLDDVVLGYEALDDYLRDRSFMGSVLGRYANRIRGGRFLLDGREVELEVNDGPNHLHGGHDGFHRRLFDVEPLGDDALRFRLVSPDGDGGYPGRLDVSVTYRLGPDGALSVDYEATTDHATPVNLTQHTYFNLAGTGSVLDHALTIHADAYTPTDASHIPTGERAPVAGTPFDFTRATPVGARLGDADEQLRRGQGYDHNFVLRGGEGLRHAARLADERSGRVLDVHTTEPGLQLYSGNVLGGEPLGKGGRAYAPHDGLCLETQAFPDSPNRPDFPSTIVRPGEPYRSRTVFAFSTARR
jgi:aldose 1-epimerase